MKIEDVIIVSDSSLLSSALMGPLREHFGSVTSYAAWDEVPEERCSAGAAVIVDVADSVSVLVELEKRAVDPSKLEGVILLLRSRQDQTPFLGFIGLLGALLPGSCGVDEVLLAARLLNKGVRVVSTGAVQALRSEESPKEAAPAVFGTLTERERAVLACMAQGCSNKAIARKLQISDSTVRVHVRAVLRKLGMQNRTQAALHALKWPDVVRLASK